MKISKAFKNLCNKLKDLYNFWNVSKTKQTLLEKHETAWKHSKYKRIFQLSFPEI